MSDASSKLTNQRVKVADGYYCDQKLRIGGILFLEELTGKGFEEIADDTQQAMEKQIDGKVSISVMVKAMQPFILSLMSQCHPDATVDELTGAINQLELEEFMALFNKLKIFADSKKNEQGPVAKKTKRQRQPVKPKSRKKSIGPKSS